MSGGSAWSRPRRTRGALQASITGCPTRFRSWPRPCWRWLRRSSEPMRTLTMANIATNRKAGRGVTVLEATLVLPIILALVFGTIEFAYVFYVKQTLQSASREGARRGAIAGSSNAEVIRAVSEAMETGGLGLSKYEVTISNAATSSTVDVSTI